MTKATLDTLSRQRNTLNGNPMYECVFVAEDGHAFTAWTKPDAQLAYIIQSHQGKPRDWTFQEWRGKLRVVDVSE